MELIIDTIAKFGHGQVTSSPPQRRIFRAFVRPSVRRVACTYVAKNRGGDEASPRILCFTTKISVYSAKIILWPWTLWLFE